MKRGVIVLVGILLVVGAVLLILNIRAGNRAKVVKETTLSVWLPFDEVKTYQQISSKFLTDKPNVKLDFKYIESKDAKEYEAKVVDEIANGRGPDIWLVRNDWIPKHAAKSLPAFSERKEANPITSAKGRLLPSVVDANTYEGKLYGVPLAGDTLAVIYNADFYNQYAKEAPQADQKEALGRLALTWSDLSLQVAGVARARGTLITRSAIALGTAENTFAPADVLGAFLTQAGTTILTDDKKSINFNLSVFKDGVDSQPAADALAYYTSFSTPGAANFSWSNTLGNPLEAFLAGKTGALIGYYSTLQEILAKEPTFKIQVAPLVQKTAVKQTERVDYGATWSHIVNKDSANGSMAWSYLSYLTDSIVLTQYAELTGKISVVRTNPRTLDILLVDSGKAIKTFATQLQTMKSFVKPEWQQVDEILQDTIKLVTNSSQTPQTSVDSAAERLKVFLN